MSDHVEPWAPLTSGELTESRKNLTERNAMKNTDDIDTEEIPQQAGGARAYQASLREQVDRLREQLATVTAERDRLKLNLASTQGGVLGW